MPGEPVPVPHAKAKTDTSDLTDTLVSGPFVMSKTLYFIFESGIISIK